MAISEHDIPRLQQIIHVALGNGASVWEIINKLEDALEGAYHPRGYGADDLDIATLVYRLGGCQLLFALNQKLSIQSLCTLRTQAAFTTIFPTIGTIRDEHFDANIQSGILSTCTDITSLHGVSIMIDEMAIEEMAVHYSKYNKIAQKIHDKEVHLGKEVTVIGAVCFRRGRALPHPSCTHMQHQRCNRHGGCSKVCLTALEGNWPIWSLATDSDATCHAVGHRLFMKKPLSSESPLYGILINMPGLNMWTGDDDVTLDFDSKHIFKCICTLIRSPSGITLNNGRVINAMMLSHYLVWLPAYDEASVMKFLHPDDPQDVPRAHDFLNNSFSPNIDRCADLMSIALFSDVIESFLIPFININLSLTEQVQYLSQFAHLSFTLFHSHRRSFMSYQLYYDMHTMVKNIMFSIVKQQVIDCLGATKDIDGVFKHHPELDPGHCCLSLGTQVEDIDHINHGM
ncbi:uncharacterized protein EDB93DRAFT_1237586 [Suillus bovinus]|uniref:uncharacterized protein n=1 Tax=Suillus bovinus TaxID=48563 RepID=UPI001B8769EE|nr:uncharacterized protein EDB93DRAFT_1237586 [Suillus bovinus]KAG2159477.1 hypothetical protein EDB93DRAFT_1237586 [Suillus bovinus]